MGFERLLRLETGFTLHFDWPRRPWFVGGEFCCVWLRLVAFGCLHRRPRSIFVGFDTILDLIQGLRVIFHVKFWVIVSLWRLWFALGSKHPRRQICFRVLSEFQSL